MATTKGSKFSTSILSIAVMFSIVGGALLIADLLDYKEGLESNKWIPVEGKIKTQSVRLVNRDGGINHFALKASYIYHIGEQAFMGNRVAFPNELSFTESQPQKSFTGKGAKSMFAHYAPEASVMVFYNPAANDHSTLTRGASARRYLALWLRDALLLTMATTMTAWLLTRRENLLTAEALER